MVICVDFDGTVAAPQVSGDPAAPLQLRTGAREALESLRRAGHVLLLCSARANRAQRIDFQLDPLVRSGDRRVRMASSDEQHAQAEVRYRSMVAFVGRELPGVFHAIDDGCQGKPVADLYLDDRAIRVGPGSLGVDWRTVSDMYGQPSYGGRGG